MKYYNDTLNCTLSLVTLHTTCSINTVVSRKYVPLFCMLASDKTGEGAYAQDCNSYA